MTMTADQPPQLHHHHHHHHVSHTQQQQQQQQQQQRPATEYLDYLIPMDVSNSNI